MMSKRTAFGASIAILVLIASFAAVFATDWNNELPYDEPQHIEFDPQEGAADFKESLNFALFEEYGPVLLILAICMFGAMIGAVCIARETVDSNVESRQEEDE